MLEVARIGRAHGLRGEVAVTLISDRTDRLNPGSQLFSDRGVLRVVTSRPNGRVWLVGFDGVADRSDAEALSGLVLRAEAVDDDGAGDDALWVHDLVGLEVIEVDGTPRGRVVAIQANPAHDLLVLADDALVPSAFIVDVGDHITIDAPEGLFE